MTFSVKPAFDLARYTTPSFTVHTAPAESLIEVSGGMVAPLTEAGWRLISTTAAGSAVEALLTLDGPLSLPPPPHADKIRAPKQQVSVDKRRFFISLLTLGDG